MGIKYTAKLKYIYIYIFKYAAPQEHHACAYFSLPGGDVPLAPHLQDAAVLHLSLPFWWSTEG